LSEELRAALAWLDAHTNLEADGRKRGPSLENMRPLVELLGSPQRDYPVLHVTGTNGKTTTTRMAAHLLHAAGVSAGCYISPHLERLNERIAWGGEPISDPELAEVLSLVAAVEPSLEQPPTYFEIVTAAAYRWFADSAVEVAAIEVGMGGTWDATNVVDAAVAVVTNVSLDHTEYLGHTREEIAVEKAGIIKPDSTLVLGETDPELIGLFLDREPARTFMRGTDFEAVENRPAHGGRLLDLRTPWAEYHDLLLPLHGAFQADNVLAGLVAAEAFFDQALAPEIVAEAFATFRSPGRIEVVSRQPLVIVDGAHNVAGAAALAATLAEEFVAGPRTLVVGMLREKDPWLMLEALGAADAAHVIACRPDSPRALDPDEIVEAAVDLGVAEDRAESVDSVPQALARALAVTPPHGQVVVAGSLYLAGEARAVLPTIG
jgi:dihydrofolate synthase / folylpolyglutamate synthase